MPAIRGFQTAEPWRSYGFPQMSFNGWTRMGNSEGMSRAKRMGELCPDVGGLGKLCQIAA